MQTGRLRRPSTPPLPRVWGSGQCRPMDWQSLDGVAVGVFACLRGLRRGQLLPAGAQLRSRRPPRPDWPGPIARPSAGRHR